MKSLGLYCLLDDGLGKWPMWLSDSVRLFLAKHMLMEINYFDFPLPEQGRKCNTLFYNKILSNEKGNCGNWLFYYFKD